MKNRIYIKFTKKSSNSKAKLGLIELTIIIGIALVIILALVYLII